MPVKPMSEEQLSKRVISLARGQGWLVAHFHAAPVRTGRIVTPVGADGKGFPDLVLVRERVLFAELKAEYRRALRAEQQLWRERLLEAGAEYYVWNPVDWRSRAIEEVLESRDPSRWWRLLCATSGDTRQAAAVQRMVEG